MCASSSSWRRCASWSSRTRATKTPPAWQIPPSYCIPPQSLADQKLDEAAHLEKLRADLQAQLDHLRHVQHVTHQALASSRTRLATAESSLNAAQQLTAGLADQLRQLQDRLHQLETQLADATTTGSTRQQRIVQLDAELRGLKSSRSWRWTAWLRSLERSSGKKQS